MGFFQKILKWISPTDDQVVTNRPGRNDDCWCGSGKKYKKCHLDEDARKISKACAINCKTSWKSTWAEFSSSLSAALLYTELLGSRYNVSWHCFRLCVSAPVKIYSAYHAWFPRNTAASVNYLPWGGIIEYPCSQRFHCSIRYAEEEERHTGPNKEA